VFLSAITPLVATNTPEGNAYLGRAQSNDERMSWRGGPYPLICLLSVDAKAAPLCALRLVFC
jgi:hypothetical protein